MEKNLIREFHDNYTNCPTYNHLKNIVNTILMKDIKSNFSISERTLRRYANGDSLPKQKDIINAIAKMVKVEPAELMQNLRDYRKERKHDNNSKVQ